LAHTLTSGSDTMSFPTPGCPNGNAVSFATWGPADTSTRHMRLFQGFRIKLLQSSPVQTFLTSGTSWTVPSNWNSANNTIEVIGAGGGGNIGDGGGGGGAYSEIFNLSLSPDASVTYQVGTGGTAGGSPTAGGDTYFNGTGTTCSGQSVCAQGGSSGNTQTGGQSSSGTGTTKFSGGTGALNLCTNGCGGGGAAGPHGAGVNGSEGSGAGSGNFGGPGDKGFGGGFASANTPGNPGTEWNGAGCTAAGLTNCGSGGGGGGGSTSPGPGGNYGGGGASGTSGSTGTGASGIIVITYSRSSLILYQQ
jgi:hypothetical protein